MAFKNGEGSEEGESYVHSSSKKIRLVCLSLFSEDDDDATSIAGSWQQSEEEKENFPAYFFLPVLLNTSKL